MHPPANSSEQQLAQALRENEELKNALREIESQVAESKIATEEIEHLLYAVSHDLRTPLRTISSYTQLLERQFAFDADSREMTAFILKGVNEMKVLIEDLLKYSRVAKSPQRSPLALAPLVQWATSNLQPAIQEAGAQITMSDLPELIINESQFVQLFEQLLSNSIKFRDAATPAVHISADETEDGWRISVRDNGIGIEPKYCETVFAPFKRLHGKEIPGTGLGLAICRKIVRAHGGKIWIESDGQHGSTVLFTVPN